MKCTIYIEDDNNVIGKDVFDNDGCFDAPIYERENMIHTFLIALQGMGYGLGQWDASSLTEKIESLIWDSLTGDAKA